MRYLINRLVLFSVVFASLYGFSQTTEKRVVVSPNEELLFGNCGLKTERGVVVHPPVISIFAPKYVIPFSFTFSPTIAYKYFSERKMDNILRGKHSNIDGFFETRYKSWGYLYCYEDSVIPITFQNLMARGIMGRDVLGIKWKCRLLDSVDRSRRGIRGPALGEVVIFYHPDGRYSERYRNITNETSEIKLSITDEEIYAIKMDVLFEHLLFNEVSEKLYEMRK